MPIPGVKRFNSATKKKMGRWPGKSVNLLNPVRGLGELWRRLEKEMCL